MKNLFLQRRSSRRELLRFASGEMQIGRPEVALALTTGCLKNM